MKRHGLTLLELLVVLVILVATATILVPVVGGLGAKSQEMTTRESMVRLQELLVNQYKADMGDLPRPNATYRAAQTPALATLAATPQLKYLFVNPDTENLTVDATATLLSGRIWRGPYVLHRGSRLPKSTATSSFYGTVTPDSSTGVCIYGVAEIADSSGNVTTYGDPTVVDAWNYPVVIQEPTSDKTYARLVSAGPNHVIDTNPDVLMPKYTTDATTNERGDDIILFLYRADQYGDKFLNINLQ
jgi:prepilin-type N-terminal cleavage/methylation domain-containing protein